MCGNTICGSAMCDCCEIVVIRGDAKQILAARQEARNEFSRRIARGGLMVAPEAAARWWPGTRPAAKIPAQSATKD